MSAGRIEGLGIGVLSWRAHATLRQSLQSYAENGFLSLFDERVIYFSDISDADRSIAAEFGWEARGGPNAGIAGGMKELAQALGTKNVVLLQNDNPIVESKAFAEQHLREATVLLESGEADLVRLRHRWQVGEQFSDLDKYLRYHPIHRASPEVDRSFHDPLSFAPAGAFAKALRRLEKQRALGWGKGDQFGKCINRIHQPLFVQARKPAADSVDEGCTGFGLVRGDFRRKGVQPQKGGANRHGKGFSYPTGHT
jgi:hypothetical protein